MWIWVGFKLGTVEAFQNSKFQKLSLPSLGPTGRPNNAIRHPATDVCTILRTATSTATPTTTADCINEASACPDCAASATQPPDQVNTVTSGTTTCDAHAARTRCRSLFLSVQNLPRRTDWMCTPDCRGLGIASSPCMLHSRLRACVKAQGLPGQGTRHQGGACETGHAERPPKTSEWPAAMTQRRIDFLPSNFRPLASKLRFQALFPPVCSPRG